MEAGSLAVRRRLALPRAVVFTALTIGPRSQSVYLLGTRAGAPVLATADRDLRRITPPVQLRPAAGLRWFVIAAAIDGAERHLVVSYHGSRTTGADLVDPRTGRQLPCPSAEVRGIGCMHDVHGAASLVGDRIVATTGSRDIVVYDTAGTLRNRIDSKLPGNHLMALARGRTREVVVTGSCAQAGGLSQVDVDTARARVLRRPRLAPDKAPRTLCGDSLDASGTRALIGSSDPTGRRKYPTGVFIVDLRRDGRVRFLAAASPLAVLAP
jgi:hypothetical protein